MSIDACVKRGIASAVGFVSGLALAVALYAPARADDKYLDLPIEKPVHGRALKTYVPPVPAPPEPLLPPQTIPDTPVEEDPPVFFGEEIPADETIFYVIDESGSMGRMVGPGIGLDGNIIPLLNRLDMAKLELKRSIYALPRDFRFNIISYDCNIKQWKQTLVEANDAYKTEASAWTDSLSPGGGTGTGVAVALALMEKTNDTIVLLTDGGPNCPYTKQQGVPGGPFEWHKSIISQANTQGAKIHVFGIGATDTTRAWMMGIAAMTGGTYTDVK